MKFLVINTHEPLPFDVPAPRNQRSAMLINELIRRGHEVVWVTSVFNHHEKKFRRYKEKKISKIKGLSFILLDCPAYYKNISFRRFFNHVVLGFQLYKYLNSNKSFDGIYCSYPPIEIAYVASIYSKATNTPFILDFRDRWPELIIEQIPILLQNISRIILFPYFSLAKKAFKNATSITGTSEGMLNCGLELANRHKSFNDKVFYMSFEKPAFNNFDLKPFVNKYRQMGVSDSNLNICFFGSFVSQKAVDFETCIEGIKRLSKDVKVQLIMCGNGPRLKSLKERCSGINKIILPGRVSSKEMWAISSISHAGLLPYKPISHFEFSIPNKVPEYLACGLPIITSLNHGTVHNILSENRVGYFYKSGSNKSFSEVIEKLVKLKTDNALKQQSKLADELYHRIFDSALINSKFADHIYNTS